MEIIRYPSKDVWNKIINRPQMDFNTLKGQVRAILESVKSDGDKALHKYTRLYDGVNLTTFAVTKQEIQDAARQISPELQQAILLAKDNIEKFHQSQYEQVKIVETVPGIRCWRKSVPIQRVGLYIPGGTAPLFSTVLMLGIPAKLAGCEEIALCTPPNRDGNINAAILFTAHALGISEIYKVGGAQAIAAMAFSTETIRKTYKIFGPGNQYVTLAKQLVNSEGTAIDLPAGPSEVAVVADESATPDFIAADMLSQAEHGSDSQVILITDCESLVSEVQFAIILQMQVLPRREIAEAALKKSRLILVNSLHEAMELSNKYAPEHLILMVKNPELLAAKVKNAGSVFLGSFAPESAGDYASGTNHTLPTNGSAKSFSGVSLDSFIKKITFQSVTPTGLQNIGAAVETMAEAENLLAHKQTVTIRLNKLQADSDD